MTLINDLRIIFITGGIRHTITQYSAIYRHRHRPLLLCLFSPLGLSLSCGRSLAEAALFKPRTHFIALRCTTSAALASQQVNWGAYLFASHPTTCLISSNSRSSSNGKAPDQFIYTSKISKSSGRSSNNSPLRSGSKTNRRRCTYSRGRTAFRARRPKDVLKCKGSQRRGHESAGV